MLFEKTLIYIIYLWHININLILYTDRQKAPPSSFSEAPVMYVLCI